jgi:hypothetical protein
MLSRSKQLQPEAASLAQREKVIEAAVAHADGRHETGPRDIANRMVRPTLLVGHEEVDVVALDECSRSASMMGSGTGRFMVSPSDVGSGGMPKLSPGIAADTQR